MTEYFANLMLLLNDYYVPGTKGNTEVLITIAHLTSAAKVLHEAQRNAFTLSQCEVPYAMPIVKGKVVETRPGGATPTPAMASKGTKFVMTCRYRIVAVVCVTVCVYF